MVAAGGSVLSLCLSLVTVFNRGLVYYEKDMRYERKSANCVIVQALMYYY